MPRPRKCRKVCCLPNNDGFVPVRGGEELTPIVLNVDEYESIRLIDREGFSQEQCGEYMRIARTTVQQIYAAARKKLADALVEGLPLRIEGGDFTLCNGNSAAYGCRNCYQKKIHPMHEKPKGDNIMRIAVTYENEEIFQHFGHTEQFKIYDVEDGKIISSKVVDAGGSGHGALAGVLSALKVDALICGGIGGGAQMALAENGIKLYGGVEGNADEAVNAFEYLAKTEGIIPAIESSHAVAYAMKLAPTMDKDKIIVVTVSGRGDKDCAAIARYRGENIYE